MIAVALTFIFFAGCMGVGDAATTQTQQGTSVVVITTQPVNTIVGTWGVEDGSHKGTAIFTQDGYVNVDSDVGGISAPYVDKGNNMYSVSYLWYNVQLVYDPANDVLKSTNQPIEFKRLSK